MKTFQTKLWIGICLVAVLISAPVIGEEKTDHLAIIVSKSSQFEDISTSNLQKYFKAEKSKTPDGKKIVIFMMDLGRPERDAALKHIYQMSESEYTDFFVSATFTGAVQAAPKALSSPAA